jgi:hypothetical protein
MEGSGSGPSPAAGETQGRGGSAPDALWAGMERLGADQIRAVYQGQRVPGENADDRKVVRLQLIVAVALILGGAALATLGILLVNEGDATKLTAIVSLCTAVIGAGAALLPTGAAAGAAAGILTRSRTSTG